MFKSMTAMAALAGLMMFGAASEAQAYGRSYAAGYGYGGPAPCGQTCGQRCAPACPRRTHCTNYTSYYRDCTPRYVAGDCMPCNSCRPSCGILGF